MKRPGLACLILGSDMAVPELFKQCMAQGGGMIKTVGTITDLKSIDFLHVPGDFWNLTLLDPTLILPRLIKHSRCQKYFLHTCMYHNKSVSQSKKSIDLKFAVSEKRREGDCSRWGWNDTWLAQQHTHQRWFSDNKLILAMLFPTIGYHWRSEFWGHSRTLVQCPWVSSMSSSVLKVSSKS